MYKKQTIQLEPLEYYALALKYGYSAPSSSGGEKRPIPPILRRGNQYMRREYRRNAGLMMFPEFADK